MKVITSCYAPFDQGGLGRYLAEVVEGYRGRNELSRYYGKSVKSGDPFGKDVDPALLNLLFSLPPIRYSLGLKDYLGGLLFDRAVACQLAGDQDFDCFHGFNGKSLASFAAAAKLGVDSLVLESANSHCDNIQRQHKRALSLSTVEDPWLHELQAARMRQEYAFADRIYVASTYSRNTFLAAGVAESKLFYRPLRVNPRYTSLASLGPKPADVRFKMLCIGRVDLSKGVAVLRSYMEAEKDPALRLHFVGGTTSRGMNRYMQTWQRTDPRVSMEPGDPLAHFESADLVVHPTYEDGFALAPMEALYAGIPALVTEDTGMKDYIQPGVNGYIATTGDVAHLAALIDDARNRPLRGTFAKPEYRDEFPGGSL